MSEEQKDKKAGLFSRKKSSAKAEQPSRQGGKDAYVDSDFIELNDLVYAPLEALADSNIQLQRSALQAIRDMGTVKQDGEESVIYLNNTNLAYEHIKPEQEDNYSVENIQLQVPTISLVPLSNLNVRKAEIGFSTEIRVTNNKKNAFQIQARICSPEQRESDFLPKISYKMKVESIPATEGLLRILDMLGTSHVAKQLESRTLSTNGDVQSEEVQLLYQQKAEIRNKIRALKKLHNSISNRISQIQNMSNSLEADMPEEIAEELNTLREKKTDIVQEIMRLKLELTEKDLEEHEMSEKEESDEKEENNEKDS